ncbi:FxSxx-COOH system tetratricopeptide repeat protein [Nonomuraea jiangxiensis]|uniref:Tetratricopeptide repeat-containing protein n=1 Tax=Nonomuraea jiangxiensis TaxID=633440 RepID=A0A1G9FAI8_9ACTN|nr:FxSxx-COOH system tetratricopeptide repeat protein [Nonomuraea jiangxiensis]SDK85355.1 Tetratricopeptide repeat-containing protein [Nonomuraea jiangxiensis]
MDERITSRPAARLPAIWGKRIPGQNKNFTGRSEILARLRESLTTGTSAALVPQALHGLGGVGKTQLAIQYAWQYRDKYDIVWWITADQAELVPSSLAGLAEGLGLRPATVVGIEEAAASVREALQRGEPYDRWLLIFDNADEPEQIRDMIPDGGPGHVLITSRNNRWSAVAQTVQVDVFARQESIAFLNRRLGREVDKKEADRLAEALGDLPLALEQAAALQDQTGISVEEYIEQLDVRTRDLLSMGKSTEYPVSMTAAWQLSVEAVEGKLPEAGDVLRCLAFFGPNPIPRDVFRRGSKGSADMMQSILADPVMLNQAFAALGRFALIKVEQEVRTVQVHRLVQALLRDSLDPAGRQAVKNEVHRLMASAAPPDPEDNTKWRAYSDLVPHVRPSGLARSHDPQVREFAINIVRYLYRQGTLASARTFAEEFLTTWIEDSGQEDRHVVRLQRHLGTVLWQLGEYAESRRLNRRTLELMQAHPDFGERHEETLRVGLNYAANLRGLGDFRGAFERDTALLEAHTELFGDDHPATIRVINNLALDHALLSEYDKARVKQRLAFLEQSNASEGVGKWDVQISWNGLARIVRLCGDYAEAVDLGEEAYSYGRKELEVEHILTLMTARDLSIAKRRHGDLAESLELAEETLARLEKFYGPHNPETMAATIALANTVREMGDLDRAFALTSEVLPRYRAAFGKQHPFLYGCEINLALLYRLRGDAAEARRRDIDTYEWLCDKLGERHELTFAAAVNLAGDLAALGEFTEARRLGERTYEQVRVHFTERHVLALSAGNNLAHDLRATGALEQAKELHARTRALFATFRHDHPDRVRVEADRRIDWDFDPLTL